MNDLENGFRTAVVGGFQRDDVLRYIEETARTHAQRLVELQEKLKQSEDARAQAVADTAALQEKNTDLAAELTRTQDELEQAVRAHADCAQARGDTAVRAEELSALCDTLTAQNDALETECARLRAENERLLARSCEYDAARDHLADIELGARRRAAEAERQAAAYADELRAAAEAEAEATRREIERMKAEYREALLRTQTAVDKASRVTAEMLDQFTGGAAQPAAEPIVQVCDEDAPAESAAQETEEPSVRDPLSEILSSVRGKSRTEGETHGAL